MNEGSTSSRATPTVTRFLALALPLLAVLLCPASSAALQSAAPASTRLTEARAVQQALANPALADLRAGWTGAAKADGLERFAWQNPSLSYTREQLLGSQLAGEDYVTISQTFDVSGRRTLARQASNERQRAAEHRATAVTVELAAEVRRRFYDLLLAQQRERVLDAWKDQVQTYLATIAKRERAGDAAAYDRLRMERELTGIEARLAAERVTRLGAWTLLHGLIDPDSTTAPDTAPDTVPSLDGSLLPGSSPSAAEVVEATSSTSEAQARRAESRALELDRRISSRWWVPSPSLGVGYKGVEIPGGRAHGLVVSLGVPLPLLDRGRADRVRTEARARTLRAQAQLRTNEARTQSAALSQEVAMLIAAARTLQGEGSERSEAVIRAAEAGYRGGEIGVTELVDAYRSAAEAELLVLDLAMRARLAEIELRRLTEAAP